MQSPSPAASTEAYRRPEDRPARRIEGFTVAGGVWATAIPFPSPLAYSYSYALRYPEGLVVVDLGWDSDEAWQAFLGGLSRAGAGLDEVIGAVERRARIAEISAWLRDCGVPGPLLAELDSELGALDAVLPAVVPDVELEDGEPVPGTGGALVAVHTPGHTAGHLCFHERERNLVLTGDHVLPKVTPSVARRPGSDPDPLRDFLSSLTRLGGVADSAVVLPGHEWPFDRLSRRLDVLREHHRERLEEIEHAVERGCDTVWKVAEAVSWAREFSAFTPRSLRSALAETSAHLVRLAGDGRIRRIEGRWITHD
ncbi:MBL fold metallo-hydrolase [Amycolatopsis saalfeldensis]|uniref:Glyoxylase, beta-lactamase superfamily II n=1 Tax=Amycolatopsis saalfeldensis TaxID=394193 RepID=A0A1H8Y8V9_9PSEU|nr:MBL fold metallo-hydrolase [Amycolatopsis saalfeldensis]SEP48579.1 Glyoxylase, beta-lactamase superfamily II [Amycolatopsis saalfeldensis]